MRFAFSATAAVNFCVDAFFDQEARGRRAAFAVERVDHEDGGVSRAFQIGIAEYDNRIFAAELEVHAA